MCLIDDVGGCGTVFRRFGSISEAARSDLYTGLSELLGQERAEILMSAISLRDFDQVANKGDLFESRAALERDISGLRAELKGEISGRRADMATEIGALRKTMTNWMLTVLVAVIGAIARVALIG